MTFGYYDKTKYRGDIEWYPNNSTNFFTIHLDDVLFGNRSMKHAFCQNKSMQAVSKHSSSGNFHGCRMIVDSGTYTVKYPEQMFTILNSPKVNWADNFNKYGCDHPEANDTITFVASGTGTRYTL